MLQALGAAGLWSSECTEELEQHVFWAASSRWGTQPSSCDVKQPCLIGWACAWQSCVMLLCSDMGKQDGSHVMPSYWEPVGRLWTGETRVPLGRKWGGKCWRRAVPIMFSPLLLWGAFIGVEPDVFATLALMDFRLAWLYWRQHRFVSIVQQKSWLALFLQVQLGLHTVHPQPCSLALFKALGGKCTQIDVLIKASGFLLLLLPQIS